MAWSIKRLVSSFKRSISRPHRPRSSIIRSIMEHAGIPVPASTAGSDDESDEICEGEEEEEMEEDPAIEEAALEIPSGSVGPAATEVKVKEEEMEKEILMVAPPSKKHKREAPTAASKIPKATNEAPSEAEKAPSETGIPSAGTPSETGKAPSETGKAPSARKAPSETGKALSDSGKAHSETGQALSATGGASNESGKAASKAPAPSKAPTTETRDREIREAPTTESPATTETKTREAPTTTETREHKPARKRVKDPRMLELKHAMESAAKRKKCKSLEDAGVVFETLINRSL